MSARARTLLSWVGRALAAASALVACASPAKVAPAPPGAEPPEPPSLEAGYVPAFSLTIARAGAPWKGAMQLDDGARQTLLRVDVAPTGEVRLSPEDVRRLAGRSAYVVSLDGAPHPELGVPIGPALACARALEPFYVRDACRDPLPSAAPPAECDDDGKRAFAVLLERAKSARDACWPEADVSLLARVRDDERIGVQAKSRVCERFVAALGDPPYAHAPQPVLAACAPPNAELSDAAARRLRQAARWLDLVDALDAARARRPPGAPAAPRAEVIAAGNGVACLLRTSGRVVCWGAGAPKELPVDDAIDVVVAERRPCVLHAGGVVSCWDDLEVATPETVRSLGDDAVALAPPYAACALQRDGSVRCLDRDGARPIAGVRGAVAVASSKSDCAVLRNGGVTCWGEVRFDAPDEPGGDPRAARLVAGLSRIVGVALGDWHLCALDGTGAVSCLGENAAGMLGDGTTDDSRRPVRVPGVAGATAIAASYIHTCAAKRGGKTMCWGAPTFAAAVDGPREPSVPGEVPGADDLAAVAVGTSQACGVRTSGGVLCWGMPDENGRWPRAVAIDLGASAR